MNLRDWTLALYEEAGKLTPEIVKEAARPEDSPAHAFVFNVPPGEAAEQYYTERAHRLIRTVKVEFRPTPEAPARRVRVWHAVTGDDDPLVYAPLDALIARPDKFAEAMAAARRRVLEAEAAVGDLDAIARDRTASSAALAAIRQAGEILQTAAD